MKLKQGGYDKTLSIGNLLNWSYFEQVVKGVISHEKAKPTTFELLHLTMPEKDSSKNDLPCALSDRIYAIWNHIAINLRKDNKVENAIQIYEELMQCYKKSKGIDEISRCSRINIICKLSRFLK